jgi:hypothetical protein
LNEYTLPVSQLIIHLSKFKFFASSLECTTSKLLDHFHVKFSQIKDLQKNKEYLITSTKSDEGHSAVRYQTQIRLSAALMTHRSYIIHNIIFSIIIISYSTAVSARMYYPKHFSIVAPGEAVNHCNRRKEHNRTENKKNL